MSQPIKLKPLSRILKDEIKERLTNLGIDFTGIKLKVDLYKRLQEALGIVPNQSQIPIVNANKDEPMRFHNCNCNVNNVRPKTFGKSRIRETRN